MNRGECRGPCPAAATLLRDIGEGPLTFEKSAGGFRKALAESRFIDAVERALPPDAFVELEQLGEGDERGCSALGAPLECRTAPCIVDIAANCWRYRDRGSHWEAPRPPEAWLELIRRFNALPIQAGPFIEWAPVITLEEEAEQRQGLARRPIQDDW